MSAEPIPKNPSERRRYFRVKDEIILFFDEFEGQHNDQESGLKYQVVGGFSLSSALNMLSEESRTQIRILEKQYPDLIACLKVLEKKIDLIAQTLLISDLSLPSQPGRKVDVSASGLAFSSDKEIEPGTLLELKMVLPPSLVAIVAKGRVVHCESLGLEPGSEKEFKVGVEFVDLADYDRELLIRHIFKKQQSSLRNHKST